MLFGKGKIKVFRHVSLAVLIMSASFSCNRVEYSRGPEGLDYYYVFLNAPEKLCEKPEKNYASNIRGALEAKFGELKNLPQAEVKGELGKSIVNLFSYTKDGLDAALLLSYTCRTSLALGLTPQQTKEMYVETFKAWRNNPFLETEERGKLDQVLNKVSEDLDRIKKGQDETHQKLDFMITVLTKHEHQQAIREGKIKKGNTYYIDCIHGQDSSPGLPDQPWRTLIKGLCSTQSGDTLVIRNCPYVIGCLNGEKRLYLVIED